ncbi:MULTISPECIES: heme biosynthesis HemY N-terminal domain-containing protein [unclassified Roseitalea]|uniref:heme biosynthesis HemY N-terminal domain-containing protein n=1 Tax=unclassified Roseitalea TaxID=2639107 RepID=UPI00273CF5C1|nr:MULTISPECIES: heme biosynthesis HemY N-terminal domain-containing protein [unclassified Roseitalea]
MIKVLIFITLVFALGFGFAWLADMPGTVEITVADQLITVSLMVAAIGIVAVVAAIMLAWWLIRVVFTSPQRMQRFFRARRRDRGYQSLSTGIIAAGAGDSATSRRMLKQANGLLDARSEPLIQLLDAQATLLEGDHTQARAKFEAMLEDPELRTLGMRGLYMEAQRLGDRDAQRHYAEKAAELAPQLVWAGKAAIDLKTASGDWEGAIRLLDKQKQAKQLSKEEANRKRAVLLTALAMDCLETDTARAKQSALEAHKLEPGFAPAATTAAQAAFRLGEMRRGVKVLETTWRKSPHPDVALAYVNARPGDSALDRLKRAQRLESIKPNNTESSLIVAQMAMEAGEFETARKAAAFVLRNEPRESAFMLMADIEDAETGDQGKVREWLSRAVRAPRDPAWTADGYVAEKWAPFSPVTGRIDAFAWKVPVERIGPTIENDLDPMVPGTPSDRGPRTGTDEAAMVTLPPAPAPAEPARPEPEPVRTIAAPVDLSERVRAARSERAHGPAGADGESEPAEGTAQDEPATIDAGTAGDGANEPSDGSTGGEPAPQTPPRPAAREDSDEPAREPAQPGASADRPGGTGNREPAPADHTEPGPDGETGKTGARPAAANGEAGADKSETDDGPVKPPIPDDPGVDPDSEPDRPRRFRLF